MLTYNYGHDTQTTQLSKLSLKLQTPVVNMLDGGAKCLEVE